MSALSTNGVLTEAIDPSSDRAVYKQIADHLRGAIGRERLGPGDQLLSEATLMAHYGVARMTARNALRLLQDEGLVTAEHGRGVYVRARPPVRRLASDRFAQRHRKEGKAAFLAEADQTTAQPDVDMITVTTAKPPADIASLLRLRASAKVVRVGFTVPEARENGRGIRGGRPWYQTADVHQAHQPRPARPRLHDPIPSARPGHPPTSASRGPPNSGGIVPLLSAHLWFTDPGTTHSRSCSRSSCAARLLT